MNFLSTLYSYFYSFKAVLFQFYTKMLTALELEINEIFRLHGSHIPKIHLKVSIVCLHVFSFCQQLLRFVTEVNCNIYKLVISL